MRTLLFSPGVFLFFFYYHNTPDSRPALPPSQKEKPPRKETDQKTHIKLNQRISLSFTIAFVFFFLTFPSLLVGFIKVFPAEFEVPATLPSHCCFQCKQQHVRAGGPGGSLIAATLFFNLDDGRLHVIMDFIGIEQNGFSVHGLCLSVKQSHQVERAAALRRGLTGRQKRQKSIKNLIWTQNFGVCTVLKHSFVDLFNSEFLFI